MIYLCVDGKANSAEFSEMTLTDIATDIALNGGYFPNSQVFRAWFSSVQCKKSRHRLAVHLSRQFK